MRMMHPNRPSTQKQRDYIRTLIAQLDEGEMNDGQNAVVEFMTRQQASDCITYLESRLAGRKGTPVTTAFDTVRDAMARGNPWGPAA